MQWKIKEIDDIINILKFVFKRKKGQKSEVNLYNFYTFISDSLKVLKKEWHYKSPHSLLSIIEIRHVFTRVLSCTFTRVINHLKNIRRLRVRHVIHQLVGQSSPGRWLQTNATSPENRRKYLPARRSFILYLNTLYRGERKSFFPPFCTEAQRVQ